MGDVVAFWKKLNLHPNLYDKSHFKETEWNISTTGNIIDWAHDISYHKHKLMQISCNKNI